MFCAQVCSFAAVAAATILLDFEKRQDSCSAVCGWDATPAELYSWFPQTFSTTIVAATVVLSINTNDDTTVTSTIFNQLPSGYTLPPTNSLGTQVTTVTYTRTSLVQTTVLAFPTQFLSFADGYTWSGTLSTSDQCVTAISSFVPFPSFPPQQPATMLYNEYVSGPDPQGLFFKPTTEYAGLHPYITDYTGEAALHSCSSSEVAPENEQPTARFITHTSVISGGGSNSLDSLSNSYLPPATPGELSSAAASIGSTSATASTSSTNTAASTSSTLTKPSASTLAVSTGSISSTTTTTSSSALAWTKIPSPFLLLISSSFVIGLTCINL